MPDKTDIRKYILSKKKELLDVDKYFNQSAALMKQLESNIHFIESDTIMMFWSLQDEPHTHNFLEKWCRTKKILLPVIVGDEIILRQYLNKEAMVVGKYGIQEPIGPIFNNFGEIGMSIIPGVAFDKKHNRLGRGKGYYDRFLAKNVSPSLYKLGICFDFQIVESLPVSAWDIPMDDVLSDA